MPNLKAHIFPFACLVLYTLASGLLLWHHEPWRDELQCWEIARQSASLPELFFNARYEGHPSAWYVLLFSITRLSDDFRAVQGLHWVMMLAAVVLVLWRSPFSRWQKILLVFGYFFLFEYGVLTRNYAIGVLLAVAICSLAKDWRRHWFALHLLLFCLLQCSLFAALIACAFFVPLFFTGIKAYRQGTLTGQQIAIGTLVFLSGLALSALDMAPPADTNYAATWKWQHPDWQSALGAFFRAMMPVPPWDKHGWGSHVLFNLLEWDQRVLMECTLSLALLLCCILSLRKSPFALAFFLLTWTAISVFLAVKMPGYIRHHGHFYLAWIMALWIKRYFQRQPDSRESRFSNSFFTLILVIQVAAVVPVAYFDWKFPFSQSRAVADFLKQHRLENRFLVGDYDYSASPVAFHLNQPIYYPNALKKGTYLLWNKEREALKYTDIVPVAMDLCQQHGDLLLLTCYPLPAEKLTSSIRLIQSFAPAMEISEEYYLYEVKCGGI